VLSSDVGNVLGV
jgi:hypothetical protein